MSIVSRTNESHTGRSLRVSRLRTCSSRTKRCRKIGYTHASLTCPEKPHLPAGGLSTPSLRQGLAMATSDGITASLNTTARQNAHAVSSGTQNSLSTERKPFLCAPNAQHSSPPTSVKDYWLCLVTSPKDFAAFLKSASLL